MTEAEQVVLLDEHGVPTGTRAKADVHGRDTPLHLAFSCYLFNKDGDLLVTRRSLEKIAWPGVWTNSFCGHPGPGEAMEEAIARRAAQELGASVSGISVALPDFRYRAMDASGIVENEVCPVYTASLDGDLAPVASEVMDVAWVPIESFSTAVSHAPFAFSPWCVEQLPLLIPFVYAAEGEL